MNVAKVSSNGQVTVPVEIRHMLRLRKGDKLLFYKKDSGEIVVSNTSLVALQETPLEDSGGTIDSEQLDTAPHESPLTYALNRFSAAMEGEWEKAGIHSEDDLVLLAAEARKEYMAKRRTKSGDV